MSHFLYYSLPYTIIIVKEKGVYEKNICKILYNKVVYIDERITYRVRLIMG